MKKPYIVKNVMKAVDRYLSYGWEVNHLSEVKCEGESEHHITSITGDIYYFHYYDCEELYADFMIRFGSRVGGDRLDDIDFIRVVKDNEGKVNHYKLMFCTTIKGNCLAEIIADTILSIDYMRLHR